MAMKPVKIVRLSWSFFLGCVKFSAESNGLGKNTPTWVFFIAKYAQGAKYPLIRLNTKNEVREIELR